MKDRNVRVLLRQGAYYVQHFRVDGTTMHDEGKYQWCFVRDWLGFKRKWSTACRAWDYARSIELGHEGYVNIEETL